MRAIFKKNTNCYEIEENTVSQFKNGIHDGILRKNKRKNPSGQFYILNYKRLCISLQSKGENALSLKIM